MKYAVILKNRNGVEHTLAQFRFKSEAELYENLFHPNFSEFHPGCSIRVVEINNEEE